MEKFSSLFTYPFCYCDNSILPITTHHVSTISLSHSPNIYHNHSQTLLFLPSQHAEALVFAVQHPHPHLHNGNLLSSLQITPSKRQLLRLYSYLI